MKKFIIITGAALLAMLMIKSAKATTQQPSEPSDQIQIPATPGKIVNVETNVVGDCDNSNCTINKDLLIYSTFRNVGSFTKTNQIGIQIDDTIVKSEYVTLNSNQEYSMMYNTQLDTEKSYNICGIIIQQ